MAASNDLVAHCTELLRPLGAVRSRRMFGGHGFYVDELFIALILDDRFYLKTDAQNRARFEAAGAVPFSYEGAGKTVVVSYFSAPDESMESASAMQPWARLAVEAALRARAAKPSAAKRAARAKASKGHSSKAPAKL